MDEFNKFLKRFGRNLADEPIYRLVFSDEQFEVRRGVFEEYYGSVFLRRVADTRLVPKYPYLPHRWILEKWYAPEVVYSSELPESTRGSYEPVFVFESAAGKPLPVTLKILEFIVSRGLEPRLSVAARALQLENGLKEREDKEIQEFMDMLDTSPVQNALHLREGVGYGSK